MSVGSPQSSNVAPGLVAGTNPSAGSRVEGRELVTIYPSSGPAPAPPPTATSPAADAAAAARQGQATQEAQADAD